jgi:hypothetical protein
MRQSICLLVLAFALAGCAERGPAHASKCVMYEAGFCVGEVAAPFDVTAEMAVPGIDGAFYLVKGVARDDPDKRFVAVVRPLHVPDISSTSDRRLLCKVLRLNTAECGSGPVRTSKQFYDIVFSLDGRPFKHGIRIDLLSASGVPQDFVASLVHPCAVLTDGTRVCGPTLGTCVQYWKTDRCDFRNDAWSDLRQMWDRLAWRFS